MCVCVCVLFFGVGQWLLILVFTCWYTEKVILFDGYCKLCHHFVYFVIKRDPGKKFRFARFDLCCIFEYLSVFSLLHKFWCNLLHACVSFAVPRPYLTGWAASSRNMEGNFSERCDLTLHLLKMTRQLRRNPHSTALGKLSCRTLRRGMLSNCRISTNCYSSEYYGYKPVVDDRKCGDSVLLIDDATIYEKSTAALKICSQLRFPYPLCYAFLVVPLPLRDCIYNWVW